MTTITDLIPVPVHGHTLFVARAETPLVPLRPICEALELDWKTQYRKVKSHPTFAPTVGMVTTLDAMGRLREMIAMPAKMVTLWLATIHPQNVAAKVRETLIAFQTTSADLLYAAWVSVRAGLPIHTGGRPQSDLFGQAASPMDWLRHPAAQEAVLLRRQEAQKAEAFKGEKTLLRRQANAAARRAGLTAAQLDTLALLAFWPKLPAAQEPDLFDGECA